MNLRQFEIAILGERSAIASTAGLRQCRRTCLGWNNTLERISSRPSCRFVLTAHEPSIRNGIHRAQATGFVVDAERGLILTNRHVVTPGPVVAEAVFPE